MFWGRSNAGLLLARSIINKSCKDQVYFMLQQKSGDGDEWRTLTRDIDDMDGLWSFTYDSNDVETDVSKDTLSQAKGRRHFFMDEAAHVNVSRADRIVTILRDNPPLPGFKGAWQAFRAGMILRWFKCRRAKVWDKPFLYVRIEAPAEEFTYQAWAANVQEFVTPVLIREVQFNHLKNYVVHIDFQQVDLNKEISAKVVLHAVGDCYGAAHGGILEQELHELEVLCRPADLPELIKVDVSSLDIGQALSVKDLVLPQGVRTNVDPEEIVFHVVMPQIEAEPAPEEAAAEPAEPEAINEKKTEARAAEKAEKK